MKIHLVLLGLCLLAGCGTAEKKASVGPAAGAKAELPAGLLLKESPGVAKDVAQARKDAKAGDEVTVRGRVGGRAKVFIAERAMMSITDMQLAACKPDEGCETPWDYCCAGDLKDKVISVQVLDAQGKPLALGLQGKGGIDHLAVVTIKGKIDKLDDAGNVTVNATGIFVEGKK